MRQDQDHLGSLCSKMRDDLLGMGLAAGKDRVPTWVWVEVGEDGVLILSTDGRGCGRGQVQWDPHSEMVRL